MILVDLLVRQLRSENIRASDWGPRYGLSEGTAARMTAGLIDAGLVGRVQEHMAEAEEEATVILTDWGCSILRAIFSAYR